MLEAIARSLRELYTVDAVTNKADCLDLLRANPFEVIVAGERLGDGSGLELLGQISKRWPTVLRIFAAEPERLKLLRGKLGPFELFQTLGYPIDPDRLLSVLTLADAAQDANADTSNIQHVVLGSDIEFDEPDPFPPPRPEPRVVPQTGAAAAALSEPEDDEPAPVPRIRKLVPGGPVIRPRVANTPVSRIGRAAPPAPAPDTRPATPGRTPSSGPAARSTPPAPESRPRGAQRPAPVRFPAIETPPAPAPARKPGTGGQPALWDAPISNALADAAVIADEARFGVDSLSDSAFHRTLVRVGLAGALVLGAVLLGYKLFGGKSPPPAATAPPAVQQTQPVAALPAAPVPAPLVAPTPPPAPPVAPARRGKRHDTDASAQIESPTPTTTEHTDSAAAASPTPATALLPETPAGVSRTTSESAATAPAAASPPEQISTPAPVPSPTLAASPTSAASQIPAASPTPAASQLPAASPTPAASASPPTASLAPAPTAASAASAVPASATAAPATATPSDEPPPVISEAKLIRRVPPDYPSAARKDGIEGSVDLEITVSAQGAVTNATVVHSDPADVFDKSALAAVRRWKYDPQYVDGLPAEAHLKIHLDFRANQESR